MKKVLKAYLTICLSVLILCFIGCGASNQESISSSQNHDYNNISKNTNMITKPESKESEKTKYKNGDKEGKEENLKDSKNQNKDSLNKGKDILNKDVNNKKTSQDVDKNKKDNNTSKEVKKTSKTSSSVSQENNKKILEENQNKDKSQDKKIENMEDKDSFILIVSKDMKGKNSKKPQVLLKKQIKISKDKNAITYLRENCTVIENGGFIKSINGNHNLYPIPNSKKTEEQKKNKILGVDWFIYLNEKKSSVGANDIVPVKGDILHFDIHEWDRSEFSF